jgi:23S rRNA pseudouridine1911/1915/1917 synthase
MSDRPDQYTARIPDELAGQRLDQALARMFPDYSRSRLKAWVLDGSVLVDGAARRPRDPVLGGESVVLVVRTDAAVRAEPEPMALDIVFEDADLLVINKPAGLVVHPGAGNASGTLMNGLLAHAPQLESLPRAGIVHRLDKDTSGLLLVAKSLPAHTALVRALADRAVSRQYLAICNGVLTGGGTIDAAIERHPVDRTRMAVRDTGRPAVTHYTVAERFRAHTCVNVVLETDPVYGGRLALPAGASEALREALRAFRRQALHAARLELRHPVTGEPLSFEAPPPADFQALLQVMREDSK